MGFNSAFKGLSIKYNLTYTYFYLNLNPQYSANKINVSE